MALTQISTQGIKDGTITGSDLTTNIDLVDSQKIRIGTSNDLQIFHSGNFNFIVNHNNKNLAIQAKDGENAIVTIPDAEVQLYHNNSLKFETTSYGAAVTGGINFSGDSLVQDNVSIFFGASNDLGIKHDGSNSEIINTTGSLLIDGQNTLTLRSAGNIIGQVNDSETAFQGIANGAVELYHNDVKKFETTSNGATLFGYLNVGSGTSNWGFLANDSTRIGLGTSQDLILQHDGTDSIINNSTGSLKFQRSGSTKILFDTNGDLGFVDSRKAYFGDGADLQIYHDGSHTYADNSTGFFHIRSNSAIRLQKIGGEPMIYAIPDGAVELYYDQSKKFETTTSGVNVTGNLIASGNVDANSNGSRVSVGDNADLLMTHINNGLIDCVTGELQIVAQSNIFLKTADSESAISCNQNGSVELYHNNVRKLHTYDNGCTVTGNLNADNVDLGDSARARFGASNDLQIHHTGGENIIDGVSGNIFIKHGSERHAVFAEDGQVELYHNNNKKFETASTGIIVSGNISIGDGDELRLGDGNDLIIKHDSANTYISNQTGELVLNGDTIRLRKGDGLEDHLKCFANGSVELYQNGTKRFETTSSGINVVGAITVNGSAFTGGKILQVLQTVKTNTFSLSTNDVDTNIPGLSVDITPTSTSSKIFVSCTWEHSSDHTNSFAMFFLRRIVSGTTNNICFGDSRGSSIQCTRSHMRVQNLEAKCSNIEFLDSPNTTSQVTYTLALRNAHQGTILVGGTSATDDDNRTSTPSVITVREVSA